MLCVLGASLFVLSWLYDKHVKYYTNRSPGLVKKEINIQNKLANNEKLTKSESFHLYSYKIWYIAIKLGIYSGIFIFITGCLLKLFSK